MKKFLSIILAFMLAVTLIVPLATVDSSAAFSIRTSMPAFDSAAGKAYYYTDNNVFYKHGYGPDRKYRSGRGGYVTGNCTWYAYGRASEILGKPLNTAFRYSASSWWSINKNGNYYPYGSTPKVGAIACYSTHVAIVEKIVNGKVYVSESGWRVSSWRPSSASQLRFNYGTPWVKSVKGYIYITDSVTDNAKNVDYSVKISADDLNMRTGPGTGYSRIGYVKKGTYKVSQESGNWAKLADSGYWICLNYVTKVTNTSSQETVSNSGTSTNYKVKITADNLNMRTGPGTSYKRTGYIKPGTYTVIMTNNGWGKISETGYWICLTYTKTVSSTSGSSSSSSTTSSSTSNTTSGTYQVKITADALNMRTGPGTSYSSKGMLKKGSVYEIKSTNNGWGQLSSNGYWIKLSYTETLSGDYNVKVKTGDLNMRTGPGTSYKSKGYITQGIHTICETKDGWGKLKSNGYWIKLSYTTKV